MLHLLLDWLRRLRRDGRTPARRAHQLARTGGSVPRAGARRLRPCLECLEDRALPSITLIGGSVYDDLNNNGLRDGNETGIADNAIQLQRPDGTVIAQGTTDSTGHYLFNQDQTVDTTPKTLVESATLSPTTTNTTSTLTVAQFDSSLGELDSVDILLDGTLVSQVKVESLDASPATAQTTTQGTLTIQAPGANLTLQLANSDSANLAAADGTSDFAGASGHDFGQKSSTGNRSVTLTAGSDDLSPFVGSGQVTLTATSQVATSVSGPGNFVSQASAQASGDVQVVYHYRPGNGLKPGQYVVHQVETPAGYFHGLNTADNLTPIPDSTNTYDIPVTLAADGQSLENNFAELKPASVSGFNYLDSNDNGILDPGEAPVAGTLIHLLSGGSQVAQATTAVDGSYSFTDLRPGSYSIQEDQNPALLDGKDTVGNLGGTAQNDLLFVALGSGDVGLNYNFGELPPAPPTSNPPPPRPLDQPPPAPAPASPPAQPAVTPRLSKLLFLGGNWWQRSV